MWSHLYSSTDGWRMKEIWVQILPYKARGVTEWLYENDVTHMLWLSQSSDLNPRFWSNMLPGAPHHHQTPNEAIFFGRMFICLSLSLYAGMYTVIYSAHISVNMEKPSNWEKVFISFCFGFVYLFDFSFESFEFVIQDMLWSVISKMELISNSNLLQIWEKCLNRIWRSAPEGMWTSSKGSSSMTGIWYAAVFFILVLEFWVSIEYKNCVPKSILHDNS